MTQELTQKEKAELFDRSMLKVLMVEFMRETNLPFALIDNPKFRVMLKFMRPDMELPSCSDLMQINIDEVETFLLWDRTIKFAAVGTEEQQAEALVSVNNDRVRLVKRDAKIFDGELSEENSRSSSVQEVPFTPLTDPKEEPLFDAYNLQTVIRKGLVEQKPEIFNYVPLKRLPAPSTESKCEDFLIKKPKLEVEDDEPAVPIDPLMDALPMTSTGLATYPCLVCQERMQPFKLRNISVSDAFIILYMGVMDGGYSMEVAKNVIKFPQFKVCAAHLDDLIENACHYFDVVDPAIDVYEKNEKIQSAFNVVNDLRSAKYANDPWYTGGRRNIHPFCASIRTFFKKYRRETYVNAGKKNEEKRPRC